MGIDDDRTDIQPINHGWLASSIDVVRGGEGRAATLTILDFQAVVNESTICHSGSIASRSQTWLRKTTQEVASIGSITGYIDARKFLRRFAKPCLASRSY